MNVEPKALVRRLSPTATQRLETAVGEAATGEYDEIVPEHLLATLLDSEDGDVAALLKHFEQDRGRLLQRVQRVLEGMRTGKASRPVFAKSVFQWLEDAWVVASIDYGDPLLRTGVLSI